MIIRTINKYAVIILFVISFIVYIPSLSNQFLWDDEEQIVGNRSVQNISKIPQLFFSGIVNLQSGQLSGGFYRPVVTSTYTLLYVFGSGSPFTFRFFQIFIHASNAVLVFLILLYLFKSKSFGFIGGLLFAVHPGISEGVLFISGLGEPLFSFFLLGSFYFFLTNKYGISIFLFFLSLLTKETAIIFIPLILVYILLFGKKKNGKTIFMGLVLFSLSYLLIRFLTVGYQLNSSLNFPSPIAQTSLFERVTIIPYIISYYLHLFLFPLNFAIQQHQITFPVWYLAPIILLISLVYIERKNKLFLFFSSWFILGIIPVLNIFPLSATVSERWLYFSIVGLIGIFLLFVNWLLKRFGHKKILWILISILIVILGTQTIVREGSWKNGMMLYAHDIKINPNSFDLVNNYGVELYRQGNVDESKKYFEQSIKLNPHWWTAYNNLGALYEKKGNNNKAEELYRKSIDKGNYYLAYVNIARLLVREKKYDEAIILLEKIVPNYQGSFELRYFLIASYYMNDQYDEALQQSQILFRIYPTQNNYQLLQSVINKNFQF